MDIKYIFIRGLRNEVEELPLARQEEIIKDYLNIFDEKNKEGLSNDEIVKELGSPSDIAFKYLGKAHNVSLKAKQVQKNIPLAIVMVILDLLVFIEVYLMVMLFLFALIALSVLVIFLPFTTFSFINFDINFTFIISMALVIGIVLVIVGLSLKWIRNLIKLAKRHLRWVKALFGW